MDAAKRTCTLPATVFGGESIPLASLLSLAAIARHTRTRTRVNDYRVLSYAISHAGFYACELFQAYGLHSDGAMNEVYATLRAMVRAGWLHSRGERIGCIYYCTKSGREQAANMGDELVAQMQAVLQAMRLDRYCKHSTLRGGA